MTVNSKRLLPLGTPPRKAKRMCHAVFKVNHHAAACASFNKKTYCVVSHEGNDAHLWDLSPRSDSRIIHATDVSPSPVRRVHFAVDENVSLVRCVSYPLQDSVNSWYQRADYAWFQQDTRWTIAAVRRVRGDLRQLNADQFTVTGLEKILSLRQARDRKRRTEIHVKTVVAEQYKHDANHLQQLSEFFSKQPLQRAHFRGILDQALLCGEPGFLANEPRKGSDRELGALILRGGAQSTY